MAHNVTSILTSGNWEGYAFLQNFINLHFTLLFTFYNLQKLIFTFYINLH